MKRRDFFKMLPMVAGIVAVLPAEDSCRAWHTDGILNYINESDKNFQSKFSEPLTEEQWDEFLIAGPAKYGSKIKSFWWNGRYYEDGDEMPKELTDAFKNFIK